MTVLGLPNITMDSSKHCALHYEDITYILIVSFGNETAKNLLNYSLYIGVKVIPTLSLWQAAKAF